MTEFAVIKINEESRKGFAITTGPNSSEGTAFEQETTEETENPLFPLWSPVQVNPENARTSQMSIPMQFAETARCP